MYGASITIEYCVLAQRIIVVVNYLWKKLCTMWSSSWCFLRVIMSFCLLFTVNFEPFNYGLLKVFSILINDGHEMHYEYELWDNHTRAGGIAIGKWMKAETMSEIVGRDFIFKFELEFRCLLLVESINFPLTISIHCIAFSAKKHGSYKTKKYSSNRWI